MTCQDDVPWGHIHVGNQGAGWLVRIKWEGGPDGNPGVVGVRSRGMLLPMGGGSIDAVILPAIACAIGMVVGS